MRDLAQDPVALAGRPLAVERKGLHADAPLDPVKAALVGRATTPVVDTGVRLQLPIHGHGHDSLDPDAVAAVVADGDPVPVESDPGRASPDPVGTGVGGAGTDSPGVDGRSRRGR